MKSALGLILVLIFLAGCRTAQPRSDKAMSWSGRVNAPPNTNNISARGPWHSVEIKPSPRLAKISTWKKFNPVWWFGNADDPVPPTWFRPEEKGRVFKWRLRNPFHNFTFYVIGIADKPHVRSGRYPKRIGNPNGGWNFAVAAYKWLRLPFISYSRNKFDFYLGWRTGGNFGGKININAKRLPKSDRPQPHLTAPSESSARPEPGP